MKSTDCRRESHLHLHGPLNHHHAFYISPNCPIHNPLLHPSNHLSSHCCAFSPQIAQPLPSNPQESEGLQDSVPNRELHYSQNLQKGIEINDEDADHDEEEEPIFVLTDEWRDFFAKSEAKRRQAKNQNNKRKK